MYYYSKGKGSLVDSTAPLFHHFIPHSIIKRPRHGIFSLIPMPLPVFVCMNASRAVEISVMTPYTYLSGF